jgi:hypothetical protein
MTITQLRALNALLDAVIAYHDSQGLPPPSMDGITITQTPCGWVVWFPYPLPDDIAPGRCMVNQGSMFII